MTPIHTGRVFTESFEKYLAIRNFPGFPYPFLRPPVSCHPESRPKALLFSLLPSVGSFFSDPPLPPRSGSSLALLCTVLFPYSSPSSSIL